MFGTFEIRSKTRVNPAGICIYCGQTDGLQDEHVVALGLGGNLILPEASCGPCAGITSAFEGKVLGGFMQEARTVGRFPTRHPNKRPRKIPLTISRGGRLESMALSPADSPGFLHLPKFESPAFLSGRPPVKGIVFSGTETIIFGKPPEQVASDLGTKTLQNTANIDAFAFVRMLAKIGYASAVAAIGPYPLSEVPVLPVIIGSADDGGTLVGSADFRLRVEEQSPQHALGLVDGQVTVDGTVERILVAKIKLFANSGATGYDVVVRRSLA